MKTKRIISLFLVLVLAFSLAVPAAAASSRPTLRKGNTGTYVKELQTLLNEVMDAGLTVDGIYGDATRRAVRAFQSKYGLSVDGVCGPKTWSKLLSLADEADEPSILRISSYNYPGTLMKGSSFSIKGTVKSNYRLTRVTVGVYTTGGTVVLEKSANPGATSYSLKNLDASIKFGSLSSGTYVYKVKAADASGTSKTLLSKNFTVKDASAAVAAFENKVLASWVAPVKAAYKPVINTKRAFGASRTNGRRHAGIDYYVANGSGTPVYAMQSGKVIEYCANYYHNTQAVAIQHADGSVANYAEISTNLRVGDTVRQGEKIGVMKANTKDGGTMLHLELYLGDASSSIYGTKSSSYTYVSGKFNRRSDLLNPEFLLNLS